MSYTFSQWKNTLPEIEFREVLFVVVVVIVDYVVKKEILNFLHAHKIV